MPASSEMPREMSSKMRGTLPTEMPWEMPSKMCGALPTEMPPRAAAARLETVLMSDEPVAMKCKSRDKHRPQISLLYHDSLSMYSH